MQLDLAKPTKGTSWPDLILQVKDIGEENGKAFPLDKESSIRPAISGNIKHRFPDRVYVANKTKKQGVKCIWVYRKS